MKIQSLVLLLLFFLSASPKLFAYETYYCAADPADLADPRRGVKWDHTPRFRAATISFPEGHVTTGALQTVIARWNNSPADFRFDLTLNDDNVGVDNGQNEVWFSGNSEFMDGFPAFAMWLDDCGEWKDPADVWATFEEVDVVFACDDYWRSCDDFENAVRWFYGTNSDFLIGYGGTERSFRATAMHEFGHALGLLHEDGLYNIMGEDFRYIHVHGNSATAYPGEDASRGAVRLYGSTIVPREDVGVVHWRYARARRDGYSAHEATRILDANGVELNGNQLDPGNVQRGTYSVHAGQEIQVEFTFENNGSTEHDNVPVYFLLSRDTRLGLGDIRLAEAHPKIGHGVDVYTRLQTIHLPGNLVAGETYRILAVVDPWDSIREVHEENNITYSRAFVVN